MTNILLNWLELLVQGKALVYYNLFVLLQLSDSTSVENNVEGKITYLNTTLDELNDRLELDVETDIHNATVNLNATEVTVNISEALLEKTKEDVMNTYALKTGWC